MEKRWSVQSIAIQFLLFCYPKQNQIEHTCSSYFPKNPATKESLQYMILITNFLFYVPLVFSSLRNAIYLLSIPFYFEHGQEAGSEYINDKISSIIDPWDYFSFPDPPSKLWQ